MIQCTFCKKYFPDDLMEFPLFVGGKSYICDAICALRERNKFMGIDTNTPFTGEMANMYYQKTEAFLRRKRR